MRRRLLVCALSIPLAVAGSLAAHQLAYRIVEPGAAARGELLERTGHGYLAQMPLVLGLLLAVATCALCGALLRARSGHEARERVSVLPFAALPPLGFTAQEHVERMLSSGRFPLGAVLEPTFVVGFLLQFPFALAAYVLVRGLLRAAHEFGAVLRQRPQRFAIEPPGAWPFRRSQVLRAASAARPWAARAPPLPV